jgi:respiratory nitrate reductase gamma subunit
MATPFDLVLYVGLPYVAIVLFFLVPIYRKYTNDIAWDWTTRASGLFDNRGIGMASLFLHWGLLFVFVGHLLGIVGGVYLDGPYVDIFFWIGAIGGVSAIFGSLLALWRRILSPRMRAMSTPQDYIIHVFLITILALSLYYSLVVGGWGLSLSVFPWFVSLFTLSPEVSGIAGAPLALRLHVIVSFLFWAYFPFTKLVHLWSAPLGYLIRPYISMRRYESIYPEESAPERE